MEYHTRLDLQNGNGAIEGDTELMQTHTPLELVEYRSDAGFCKFCGRGLFLMRQLENLVGFQGFLQGQ
jgi:hypothetical protein